jgi:thymidylate synthase (FAD)
MKVELVDYSQNALGNIVAAGRNCYQSKGTGYESDVNLAKALIKADHTPVEFGWAMWHIKGISRACADQLARYRLASFTMLSQRYVDIKDIEFIHPFKVMELAGETALAVEQAQRDFYKMLLNCGISKEDARYYMGMGFSTEVFMACNFRELRHILKQRLDPHAQWEIRMLAKEMLNICKEKWGWLVYDF